MSWRIRIEPSFMPDGAMLIYQDGSVGGFQLHYPTEAAAHLAGQSVRALAPGDGPGHMLQVARLAAPIHCSLPVSP